LLDNAVVPIPPRKINNVQEDTIEPFKEVNCSIAINAAKGIKITKT
jgi:hypothetical protein